MNNPVVVSVAHPDRVNLTFCSDIHLAAKAPGRRRGTYQEEILSKLAWTAALTHKVQGAGLCGGDVFHAKAPRSDSNTLSMITEAIATFQQFPGGCISGAIGNHDVTADNLETLPNQPLGNLVQAGVYRDLSYAPVVFETASGLRVLVDAFDYVPGEQLLAQIIARSEELKAEFDAMEHHGLDWEERPWHYAVAIPHAFNKPGKSEMMFNVDFALGWADLADTAYDAFLWGHDHARKGINQQGGRGPWHVQLGSLARAALSQDEVDRPVAVAVLSFSREGLKIIEKVVPVSPLELAFVTADLGVEKIEKREDVAQFLQELETHAQAVDSENPMEILRELTKDPDIIRTIVEVCELT
jgi:hypothetical protein